MRRTLLLAVLLVGGTVVGAFAYRAYAQQDLLGSRGERNIARNMLLAAEQQAPGAWPGPEPPPGRRILIADAAQQAPAAAPVQPPGPVHVVTFVDITPNNRDAGTALCKQYAADTRRDNGNTSSTVLAQANRPNHLVLYQVWQNQAAFEAHEAAQHTKDFRAKMLPMLGSPFDQRPHYVVP
jgi:quinol monooxygenase YgiN